MLQLHALGRGEGDAQSQGQVVGKLVPSHGQDRRVPQGAILKDGHIAGAATDVY